MTDVMRARSTYGPLHAGFSRHRKIYRLAELLDIPRGYAAGIAACLWSETWDTDGGVLAGWTWHQVSDACAWHGEAEQLISALADAGLISVDSDGALVVAGWEEYGGASVAARAVRAERNRRFRSETHAETSHGNNESVSRDVSETSQPLSLSLDLLLSKKGDKRGSGGEKRGRKKVEEPASFDDLLNRPYRGFGAAIDFFRSEYPAFDGKAGRLPLEAKIEGLREWWERQPAGKRRKTPVWIHDCLSRDYQSARASYERDMRNDPSMRADLDVERELARHRALSAREADARRSDDRW
jgi:hypothetical protein